MSKFIYFNMVEYKNKKAALRGAVILYSKKLHFFEYIIILATKKLKKLRQ